MRYIEVMASKDERKASTSLISAQVVVYGSSSGDSALDSLYLMGPANAHTYCMCTLLKLLKFSMSSQLKARERDRCTPTFDTLT